MRIIIKDADFNDFNVLAKLARQGMIHTFCMTDEDEERQRGEWLECKNGNIKCNQCGCEIRYSYILGNKPDFPKFCCNCGAKMKTGGGV